MNIESPEPEHLKDPLDEFIRQMGVLLDYKCYYACLSSCMILIDTCAGLESDRGGTTEEQFKKWFELNLSSYLKPENSETSISSDDCYNFRCKLLHQSRSKKSKSGKSGSVAFSLGPGIMHKCQFEGPYLLDIATFMNDLIVSVREWRRNVEGTSAFKKNYEYMIRISNKPPFDGRGCTYIF
jgi:hypothetical protein